MVIFAEKNKEIREAFAEALPWIETVDDMFSVPEPKVVVTCSNPNFTMGGGIDALIKKHYPEECKMMRDTYMSPGLYERVGRVLFAVTVDQSINANEEGIRNILRHLNTLQNDNETYVFTGMGTGIGGGEWQEFIKNCRESIYEQRENR